MYPPLRTTQIEVRKYQTNLEFNIANNALLSVGKITLGAFM